MYTHTYMRTQKLRICVGIRIRMCIIYAYVYAYVYKWYISSLYPFWQLYMLWVFVCHNQIKFCTLPLVFMDLCTRSRYLGKDQLLHPQILWAINTHPYPWYLVLAHQFSFKMVLHILEFAHLIIKTLLNQSEILWPILGFEYIITNGHCWDYNT